MTNQTIKPCYNFYLWYLPLRTKHFSCLQVQVIHKKTESIWLFRKLFSEFLNPVSNHDALLLFRVTRELAVAIPYSCWKKNTAGWKRRTCLNISDGAIPKKVRIVIYQCCNWGIITLLASSKETIYETWNRILQPQKAIWNLRQVNVFPQNYSWSLSSKSN